MFHLKDGTVDLNTTNEPSVAYSSTEEKSLQITSVFEGQY